ncbi:MAG: aldehyde dehydrogenase family protein, partial [Bosea sp. (in: a-proteobacteria)]|nr:aldehyde dehydrogenase family protein [Bosea sp. (in: a-proteobacteria)]
MTDFAPDSIAFSTGHYIGGEVVEAGERIAVSRPSDGATYADLPIADAETVDRAVTDATKAVAASGWATQPPRERARALRRWADLIEERAVELGRLEAVGSTRPIAQAVTGDVASVAEGIRFFSEWADKLGGEVAATRHDHLGLIVSEPYGVVGAITPWNFPLSMASWKVGPALAAGNAIVLKPSELTPYSTLRLAELAVEAGIPAGIFNVVQGNGVVTGDALSRHPGIAKLSFTGSTRTGIAVMKAAAETGIKPVTLELGGKSANIVFADAAIDNAVKGTVSGIFAATGQTCIAGSRALVQRSIHDEFVDKLVALAKTARMGDPALDTTQVGPITTRPQRAKILDYIDIAKREGAQCALGGAAATRAECGNGWFVEPTIFTGVAPAMRIAQEEVFGPVLSIIPFDDADEAVEIANGTQYGLAAGVWTQ